MVDGTEIRSNNKKRQTLQRTGNCGELWPEGTQHIEKECICSSGN